MNEEKDYIREAFMIISCPSRSFKVHGIEQTLYLTDYYNVEVADMYHYSERTGKHQEMFKKAYDERLCSASI